jgi:hypothetical protein
VAKTRTGETGETGELLVLAELYRRGVLGGQAARGARGIDLLTSTGPTVQVKAKRGKGRWVLGRERHRPAAAVVVLVSVGMHHADDEFFVVPADVLLLNAAEDTLLLVARLVTRCIRQLWVAHGGFLPSP